MIPQDKIDAAKQQRMDNKIQPTHAPGQSPFGTQPPPPPEGSPFGGGSGAPEGSPFGGGSGAPGGSPFGGGSGAPGGSPFGGPPPGQSPFGGPQPGQSPFGSGFNNTPNPMQQQMQQQMQQKSLEDKMGDGLEKGAKGIFAFIKELGNSFKYLDINHLREGANRTFYFSGIVTVLGGIFGIFKHNIWWVAGGGLITIPIAMLWSKIMQTQAEKKGLLQQNQNQNQMSPNSNQIPPTYQNEQQFQQPNQMQQPYQQQQFQQPFQQQSPQGYGQIPPQMQNQAEAFNNDLEEEVDEDSFEDEFDWEDEEEEEEEFDWDEDEDEDDFTSKLNLVSKQETESDIDSALEDLEKVNPEMVSKQFLLDSFLKASESITPNYAEVIELEEDSNKFEEADAIVKDIFSVLGFDEDNDDIPDLQEYRESLFVDELLINRPNKKFKLEDFDREFTQILKKGYNGKGGNIKMFSKSELIGRSLVVRIFKGVSPMVSIRDVVSQNRDFFLDNDYLAPVVLGINEEGKEVKFDILEEDGFIVAGKKRSGKSYTVRSLLHQMMIFNGPSKVHFFVGDVKGAASDFYQMKTPHVRQFESEPLKILKMIEWIVNTEAKRRDQRFKEAGVIKISDYHDENPEATDMPYLYLVLDEMVGLSTKLKELSTKEVDYKNIYYGYLTSIVTMLPALGIFCLFVPHRVTNDFLPKTASDNMTFKMAVRPDEGLLKEVLNVTEKQFGFSTPNKGDLAIKCTLVKPEPFYSRSVVPARTTQESDKLFEFQGNLWAKLEPQFVAGSYMEKAQNQQHQYNHQTEAMQQRTNSTNMVKQSPQGYATNHGYNIPNKSNNFDFGNDNLSIDDIEANTYSEIMKNRNKNKNIEDDDFF